MWHRFPQPMRDVILAALIEAARESRVVAEPADFLSGIRRVPSCAASYLLRERGIGEAPQTESAPAPANEISQGGMRLIEQAYEEASRLKDRAVGSDHLLLALLKLHASDLSLLSKLSYDEGVRGIRRLRRLGIGPDAPIVSLNPLVALASRGRKLIGALPKLWKLYVGISAAHPKLLADPYPVYDEMLRKGAVRRDPILPVWIVTGYAEVAQVFRDDHFSSLPLSQRSASGLLEVESLPAGPVRRQLGVITNVLTRMMVMSDDPVHARMRSQFGQMFSPRNVARLRGRVQQIADELLDTVAATGRMDFIKDFACPLPLYIVSDILGFQRSDWQKLFEWSEAFRSMISFRSSFDQDVCTRRAMIDMRRYFDDVVAQLRAHPNETLLSQLVNPAPGTEAMDVDDLFGNCVFLLAAGHVTTTSVMGNGLRALLRHPAELQRMRDDPSLMPGAVEELLRLESPVQWSRRRATEDVMLGDKRLEKGSIVLVSMGAANRDSRQFADPHRLDITRKDAAKHLAFSGGGHYCLGAGLARIELQIGFETLLRRLRDIRIVEGFQIQWKTGQTLRAFDSLPITFRAASEQDQTAAVDHGSDSAANSFETRRGTTANATSG